MHEFGKLLQRFGTTQHEKELAIKYLNESTLFLEQLEVAGKLSLNHYKKLYIKLLWRGVE